MNFDSNSGSWEAGKQHAPRSSQTQVSGPAGLRPWSAAAAAPARTGSYAEEKRRYPRFKCEGKPGTQERRQHHRTWATFTDVSTAGCYVAMMTTFPVGTKMELQLG